MIELGGEDLPAELSIRLGIEPSDDGRREVGIAHAVAFAWELFAGGAPGLHLCTLNQDQDSLAVLDDCCLLPIPKEEPV